jgi:hypothetical protein
MQGGHCLDFGGPGGLGSVMRIRPGVDVEEGNLLVRETLIFGPGHESDHFAEIRSLSLQSSLPIAHFETPAKTLAVSFHAKYALQHTRRLIGANVMVVVSWRELDATRGRGIMVVGNLMRRAAARLEICSPC